MVSVPARAPPVLTAALNATVPLPVPLAPDVIVIHPTLAVAAQVQLPAAVTATVPVAPEPATLTLVGAMEGVHAPG